MSGQIFLAGTPIGNAGDASQRLREVLAAADIIAAEDTRKFWELARRLELQIAAKVVAFHDHNEASQINALTGAAASGAQVVVVSDAGMPTISDPGLGLVREAIANGVAVTVVPGPSAVLAALAVSGLPTDRFTFEGFLPRKAGARQRVLTELTGEQRTMVFFEAPHRIVASLRDMVAAFGPRPAALAREITKPYEQVRRGDLTQLLAGAEADPPRGELVLVVGGNTQQADPQDLLAQALSRIEQGERAKSVATDLAHTHGVSARELYAVITAARQSKLLSD